MGALDFSQFKDFLKYRAGTNPALETATPGSTAYNMYGVWVNSAYRQLCTQDGILGLQKKLVFPQLHVSTTKSTTDGTAYVTVPSNFLYITEVYDTTNNRKLNQISWKKYIEYTDRTTTTAEGEPTEWVRSTGYIYLHPTPDTSSETLTVYYKKLVADLTGTQTTDIGAEWDDVILELAAYKMFIWTHDYDKSKFCRDAFLEMAGGLAGLAAKEGLDNDLSLGPSLSYIGA
jgi:hypothetical protein